MGITAGRVVVPVAPNSCWVSRSSSRNGSVRISIVGGLLPGRQHDAIGTHRCRGTAMLLLTTTRGRPGAPTPGQRHGQARRRRLTALHIGTAANLLGVQPAFLRSLDAAGVLTAGCSAGGQRRYSRAERALATRVRELLDQNMPLTAATCIVSLEHQLQTAYRRITNLEQIIAQRDTGT